MIDCAIYVDGRRTHTPDSLAETYRDLDADPEAMAWIGLYRPSPPELVSLAEEFNLHELAVEDAIVAHQRPKVERYGDTLFVVMHAARYLDDVEEVEFGELHIFMGPNFVVSVRHSESPDLSRVRSRMESHPELLGLGGESIVYAIMDSVVDGYFPVARGLENDIDEIEIEVFNSDPTVSRRIYELSREVAEFQRALHPLTTILDSLAAGFDKYGTDEELRSYLRDVEDHVAVITEQVDGFRDQLRDMLTVNATLVAQSQNEEMKNLAVAGNQQNEAMRRISAWAAVLFVPTLISGWYGMNYDTMPELHWRYGYLYVIGLMIVAVIVMFTVFKKRGWL